MIIMNKLSYYKDDMETEQHSAQGVGGGGKSRSFEITLERSSILYIHNICYIYKFYFVLFKS